ncbi:MAG: hypothetical protein ACU85U_12245 [Gammaproteobacteria bacterium]
MEAGSPPRGPGFKPFGDDGLTFADVIDIVNPLQHIPVVSTFYRKLTGDTIDPAMRIAGGALFGGPLGALSSTMAVAIDEVRRAPFDASVEADGQVAEHAPPLHGNPVISANPRSVNAVARREPAGEAQSGPHETGPIAARQPRRGGWMVAQAYGETLNRFAEVVPDKSRLGIDETV